MKKYLLVAAMSFIGYFSCFGQQVTKFLGIPVDGFKKEMIQKLEAKGFEKVPGEDYLEGEFNGEKVNVFIKTNNNKVWRIAVSDVNLRDEGQIKIRFNNLCSQFAKNKRYTSFSDSEQTIPENEDIGYQMAVHDKQYQACFFQISNDENKVDEEAEIVTQVIKNKYGINGETIKQLMKGKDIDVNKIDTTSITAFMKDMDLDWDIFSNKDSVTIDSIVTAKSQAFMIKLLPEILKLKFEKISKRTVWFNLFSTYGKYSIMMFYDNEYNKADGSDL